MGLNKGESVLILHQNNTCAYMCGLQNGLISVMNVYSLMYNRKWDPDDSSLNLSNVK